jgi:hypothetical protein
MLPIIGALLPIVGKVIDKVIPDVAGREAAKMEIQLKLAEQENELSKLLIQADVAQTAINLKEAESSDKFVARARPAIMWICAFGLAWQCVLLPVLGAGAVFCGHPEMVVQLPPIDSKTLLTIMGYLLGYGGLRTIEKFKGVES